MFDFDEKTTFNAAINILAVKYLVKTNNTEEYGSRCDQVQKLDLSDLQSLNIVLSLNMHIGNLGEMITHGDYDYQVVDLIEFLDK